MLHFVRPVTCHGDQRFEQGNHGNGRRGRFTRARPIIDQTLIRVAKPFLRMIEQLNGIGEIEHVVGGTAGIGT